MANKFDLLVRNAHVIDADGEQGIADIGITGGLIAAVEPSLAGGATTELDVNGSVVLPGVVDSHAHLPENSDPHGRTPAHHRLARAGVTTAVDFSDFRSVLNQWHASAAGLTVLGLQSIPVFDDNASSALVRANVEKSIHEGAIGIKLMGGHRPNSSDISGTAIAEGTDAGCYVAFHAGTKSHGSNLDGMREALELAEGRPLHLAHTNAYLRGAVTDIIEENNIALALLREHPRAISESHLGSFNWCGGELDGDQFVDHVTRNCLRLGGYSTDRDGLIEAFADGYAFALHEQAEQALPVTGDAGRALWDDHENSLCFPVNGRLTGFIQTCARRTPDGSLRYDGDGEFAVEALSSDGGTWRNVILDQGLALVHLGALSLAQLADKTSRAPAKMFGLWNKGKIAPGYDADLVAVDTTRRVARLTIAAGQVIFDGHTVTGTGGTIVTTEHGVDAVKSRNIPCQVVDLKRSTFLTKGTDAAAPVNA
ncbi:amidohydrolase family protein [Nocardia sp. NPDC059246]|uniref:amidohydrolase family protein n=1 Tax=unclassified Nocardia TaxID=2637762 RepID=UPI0036AC439A